MKIKLLFFTFLCSVLSWGQVNISATGSYSQSFDGLINTSSGTWADNSTIANWYSQRSGTGTSITSGTGSLATGDLYSFGTASGNTERALGSVGTSNAAAGHFAHGMLLRNTSGTVITDIKVSYKMEQWRNSAAAAAQTISFYYKISSTSFTALNPNSTTGWTAVASLNANSPITGGTAGALNGNLGANQVSLTGIAIPSLSLVAGDYIMIKWDDPDHSGSDHGLSIDDVIVDWTVTPLTCSTPTIGTNPSTTIQNLCVGASATTLTVAATGSPTLTYQWYSNTANSNAGGTLITGATSSTYTPSTVTAGTLYYYCEVGSTCLPTPTPAVSNVSGAITVNAVPANPAGAITVSANPSCGPATLSYPAGSYWQTAATGTLTTSPTSSNYTLNASGTVYIRDFNGTCWSAGAINSGAITINTPVAITTQPANSAIFSGSSTTFSVVATGTTPTYQWQVNTGAGFVNLTNTGSYSGVTTATMTITAATVGMNGYLYQCVVSGATPCASVTSSSALLTVTVYVPAGTVFNPGELMFVGYDAQYLGSGQHDEYLIATMVDILPGTQFTVVNSRYEAGAAANVRTDKWGGGGDFAEEAPYEAILTYNGVTIPAGSVLRFRTDGSINWFGDVAKIIGTTITTITGDFSGTVLGGTLISPNVSTSSSDQMYLIQGNFVSDGTIDLNQANYYLNGTLLHGITNRAAWVALSAGCNGSTTISPSNVRESRLPSALTCFNVEATGTNNESGFYENDKQHGTATIRQIVNAVADVTNNWTLSTGRYNFNPSNSLATSAGKTYLIGISNSAGQWVGNVDTNWFNCANWEGLAVPKISTDVTVNAAAVNFAAVSYTAPYSNEYNDIAVCNNLTITGSKVEIIASVNNKLEVYGDLLIDSPAGALDMDDSTIAADGQLYLFGNWTNNMGNAVFSEGDGTVHFTGSTPQIISNVTPEGTETFHHLVLNNDFTTAVSNDIIANGDLTVGAGKTLVVSANDYVQVTDNVANNGTFNILNSGSLVQINDAGVNTGNNISMKRTASQRLYDYIYWSSPVANFPVTSVSPTTSPSYIYKWETLAVNANGGQGNWINTGENMALGKGYIVRGASAFNNTTATSWTADFVGIPNNGIVPVTLSRGTNLPSVSVFDDNWSLIGNPYPSAIDADSFINRFGNPAFPAEYKDIEGSVRIWTHNTLPASIASPFYQNFVLNYTPNDYITYNSLGSQTGPATFNGKIAAGQSFLVLRNDGATDATTLNFDNALRSKAYNNSQFFRQSNVSNTSTASIEKNRIWIDLVSPTNAATRTLVGYVEGATLTKDNTFDAFTDYKNATNFYSLIGAQPVIIQGRPTPFDVNDKVPMGIKIPTSGTYTIAIAAVDGLFSGKAQKIYIEDKLLNTINDITDSPYQFTATQGITNDRFVLRYTNQALSNADFNLSENAVTVFASNNEIKINSSSESIKNYTVYNVLGQTLAEKNNVNTNQSAVSSILKNNQALIVKVTLTNGQTIIKKIIF